MLIQIANTCHMFCPHCMQRSDAGQWHMSMETVEQCARHAEELGVMAIMISGGEPTEHPQFKEIVRRFLKFPIVCIISNGDWADNLEMIKTMRWLLSHKNVSLQITNIPGIYPREVNIRKIRTLFPRVAVEQNGLLMMSLGRATEHEEFLAAARQHPYTTSCFSSALTSAQMPYPYAIRNMEVRGKFCHPLIDWKGGMHWSESCQCPSFADISEPLEDIAVKAHRWRPCGSCPDYKKLLDNNSPQYIAAKEILGIK